MSCSGTTRPAGGAEVPLKVARTGAGAAGKAERKARGVVLLVGLMLVVAIYAWLHGAGR